MSKGDKTPASLPVEEVAQTLKVSPSQILEWMEKTNWLPTDKTGGIRLYDFKKFQLEHPEEIRKAQAQALKDEQQVSEKRKPAKGGGFFSRLFGNKSRVESEEFTDSSLAQENKRLRDELAKMRAEAPDPAVTGQMRDKIRFLEGKLAKVTNLEQELLELRLQLATGGGQAQPHQELEQQLQATRELMARQGESIQATQEALRLAETERDNLRAELAQLSSAGNVSGALEAELDETRQLLRQVEEQLQAQIQEQESKTRLLSQLDQRVADLQQQLEAARESAMPPTLPSAPAPTAEQAPPGLIEDLLALQEANLARFSRLHDLYHQAQSKLAQAPAGGENEANYQRLQAEFETLRVKHQSLLEARETSVPGHQEFVEQLAAARVTTTRLRQENAALKSRLAEADVDKWKQKVEELQQRLAQGSRANDASLELVETELRAVRKSLQNREAQVQKIAGRLQENERSLKKALKESTRLTELLIERENRLRDLSTEYEQEYRDKIDNLDRQVSGLQWKLSLREERIASLESEVSELRRTRG